VLLISHEGHLKAVIALARSQHIDCPLTISRLDLKSIVLEATSQGTVDQDFYVKFVEGKDTSTVKFSPPESLPLRQQLDRFSG
jgi:hypothetical protein